MKMRKILAAYMAILLVFTTYVALDTFVITRVYGDASQATEEASGPEQGSGNENDDQAMSGDIGSDDAGEAQDAEDAESGRKGPGGLSGHAPGSGNDMGPGSGNGMGPGSGNSSGKGPGQGQRPGSKSSSSGSSSSESKSSGESASTQGKSASSSVSEDASSSGSSSQTQSAAAVTSDSYKDSNISITLKEYRTNDTTVYVADVEVSSPEYLKTALAQGAYGKNVTAKTSETAANVSAILAVNGDYYGAQEKGYVIRNGKIYRNTAVSGNEDLVIYKDGSFGIINESEVTAEELLAKGAVQTLSFGPALVENGSVTVSEGEEVGRAMASNPRTAIGIIDDNHYVFVVSDGRTDASEGLSLYQLAQFMDSLGVTTAYNLDGGGSSTMYFNGKLVNNPTTGGTIKERSVSDIVYIGY